MSSSPLVYGRRYGLCQHFEGCNRGGFGTECKVGRASPFLV